MAKSKISKLNLPPLECGPKINSVSIFATNGNSTTFTINVSTVYANTSILCRTYDINHNVISSWINIGPLTSTNQNIVLNTTGVCYVDFQLYGDCIECPSSSSISLVSSSSSSLISSSDSIPSSSSAGSSVGSSAGSSVGSSAGSSVGSSAGDTDFNPDYICYRCQNNDCSLVFMQVMPPEDHPCWETNTCCEVMGYYGEDTCNGECGSSLDSSAGSSIGSSSGSSNNSSGNSSSINSSESEINCPTDLIICPGYDNPVARDPNNDCGCPPPPSDYSSNFSNSIDSSSISNISDSNISSSTTGLTSDSSLDSSAISSSNASSSVESSLQSSDDSSAGSSLGSYGSSSGSAGSSLGSSAESSGGSSAGSSIGSSAGSSIGSSAGSSIGSSAGSSLQSEFSDGSLFSQSSSGSSDSLASSSNESMPSDSYDSSSGSSVNSSESNSSSDNCCEERWNGMGVFDIRDACPTSDPGGQWVGNCNTWTATKILSKGSITGVISTTCEPGCDSWSASVSTSCPGGSASIGGIISGCVGSAPPLWSIIFDPGECDCVVWRAVVQATSTVCHMGTAELGGIGGGDPSIVTCYPPSILVPGADDYYESEEKAAYYSSLNPPIAPFDYCYYYGAYVETQALAIEQCEPFDTRDASLTMEDELSGSTPCSCFPESAIAPEANPLP